MSRRENVPFDPYYFEHRAREGETYSLRDAFCHIYRNHHWSGSESVSGEGAGTAQTRWLQRMLPALLAQVQARVLLDLPCGDFGWMQSVRLPVETYIGADIVPEMVSRNRATYGRPDRLFVTLDLTRDELPLADVLLCRDCLVHFSYADIRRALANVKRSGIRYLLTTTFPEAEENEDIVTGDWRVLNLERAPFHFPPPLVLINEHCTEGSGAFRDKSLGLWSVEDLAFS